MRLCAPRRAGAEGRGLEKLVITTNSDDNQKILLGEGDMVVRRRSANEVWSAEMGKKVRAVILPIFCKYIHATSSNGDL